MGELLSYPALTMKKLFILTLCVTTLIYLIPSSPEAERPLAEAPVAVVEAQQATIAPEPVSEPIPVVETIVEPVQEPTINQAQANVVLNPVGCEHYRDLVSQYNWDVSIALAIMKAESGCNPEAHNPEAHRDAYGNVICYGSFGLMQISCHSGQIYDPAQNMAAAWAKYQNSGWRPWGAYTNGAYLRYL